MNRFIWKLVLNGLILVPFLYWFTNASLIGIATAAVILAIVSYFIGDQFILRRTNNLIATLADGILAYAYLWVVASTFNWTLSQSELLTTVISLAIVEAIYHAMLVRFWDESRDQINDTELHGLRKPDIATQEFSEELGKRDKNKKDEDDPNIYRWDD